MRVRRVEDESSSTPWRAAPGEVWVPPGGAGAGVGEASWGVSGDSSVGVVEGVSEAEESPEEEELIGALPALEEPLAEGDAAGGGALAQVFLRVIWEP